ncbi:MAG: bifunctional oligoribonuclease/PAP phosphatase NrnA [Bacteroidetes bacterium]|nr:bifunctional oligoribonuclease/PAP phosphatase NrnA [Bacteroidota bacterium]
MLEEIVSALKKARRVVITTHTRPDGDAIGSQLALGNYLKRQGKDVLMVNQDQSPYNLEWLPGADHIELYDASLRHVEFIAHADVVVILDTNVQERLGSVGKQVRGTTSTKILVDHHTDSENWFDLTLKRESASSTAELLFELFELWDLDGIDHDVAAPLYVAMMTDTGSFRFSNVSANLHRMVAELIERGKFDPSILHAEVYDKKSIEGIKLLSSVLSSIELHYNGRIGTVVVTRRMLSESGASVEETDGFVNQVLSIEGVLVALIFTETERGTKISFRSKGDHFVHKWAQSYGGGGHRNASGAFIIGTLDHAFRKAIASAPHFINLPNLETSSELSDEDAAYLNSLMNSQNN